jgi:hypothetical protein
VPIDKNKENTMPLKVGPAEIKEYVLEKSDALFENTGEPSAITVRKALKGEDDARSHMFSLIVREQNYGEDSVRFSSPVSIDDIRRKEVFLVLASCNLIDSNDKPVFTFKNNRVSMTEFDFSIAFGQLPIVMANEIIDCVLDTNPRWVEF